MRTWIGIVLPGALAAVFAVAGGTKLIAPGRTRRALEDFGIPAWAAPVGSRALPATELVVAAAVLVPATRVWGAVAAVVLLAAFTVAVAANLAKGRRPDCNCFGATSAQPIGSRTLLRNGLLIALAGAVLLSGGSVPVPAVLFVGLMVAGTGAAVVALLARRPRTVEPVVPAVNGAVPDFALSSTEGDRVTLTSLREHGPVLLVFSDPRCGPCRQLLPEVVAWQGSNGHRVAVVSRGSEEDIRAEAEHFGVRTALIDPGASVAEALRVPGTPSAVVVRQDGSLGSPVMAGAPRIRELHEALSGGSSGPADGDHASTRTGSGPASVQRRALFARLGAVAAAAVPIALLPGRAGAHITQNAGHNWRGHYLNPAKNTFYTKHQANNRFFTRNQANNRFSAKSHAHAGLVLDFNELDGLPCSFGGADGVIELDFDGSGVASFTCVPEAPEDTCSNGVQDGDETGVDCGGSCPPCGSGQSCNADTDCDTNLFCDGSQTCVPTKSDGAACAAGSECQSGNCSAGICCAVGSANCGGVCQNLATHPSHCGGCGVSCSGGQVCIAGVCQTP